MDPGIFWQVIQFARTQISTLLSSIPDLIFRSSQKIFDPFFFTSIWHTYSFGGLHIPTPVTQYWINWLFKLINVIIFCSIEERCSQKTIFLIWSTLWFCMSTKKNWKNDTWTYEEPLLKLSVLNENEKKYGSNVFW